MTKAVLTFCAVIIGVTVLHAFQGMRTNIISGKINPTDGAGMIWAVQGNDSVKTDISKGKFDLRVAPGAWKVVVDARPPYKGVIIENVRVMPGDPTDLGEIRLQE